VRLLAAGVEPIEQLLEEIGIELFVGTPQGRAADRADIQVVALGRLGTERGLDVPQTVAAAEMPESQCHELAPA